MIFDEPRRLDLDIEGTVAGNLDRLPDFQNIPVSVDHLGTIEARLSYSDVRNSLGSVDEEKGRRWSVKMIGQQVDGRFVPAVFGTYDTGLALPIGHSSVWARGAAGFSPSDRDDPFANFFFGAFGNNWVDHQDEKRYRSAESFPGADLNEIGGRNFVKGMIELNLPPWRFRRAGTPGFHAAWMRPALFVGALATNLDAEDVKRVATNVGGQVDFRFSLLSALEMTVSVGAAVAFEEGFAPRREAMFSVKILR
jgi:hypothetical protein